MKRKLLGGLSALLCALILICTFAVGFSLLTADETHPPSLFGFSPMVVVSGSMEPEFPVGTFLISRQAAPSQVEVGDIITFYGTVGNTTGVITHRVIEKEGEGDDAVFTTRGDANPVADPNPVTRSGLIGKVVWHSPLLGKLIGPLRSGAGRIILFVLAALLIGSEVISLLRGRAREDAEEETEEE